MYERSALLFLYCVSPLHMGAGTALGAIDNPIQRERHTRHPMIVGSGIKGALRHACWSRHRDQDAAERNRLRLVFGPDTQASSEHAGALSLSDAQIVCFPVRSLRHTFVYATSRTALARLTRLLLTQLNGHAPDFARRSLPDVKREAAVVLDDNLLGQNRLTLEAYQFEKTQAGVDDLRAVARWLADHAVPGEHTYFRDKLSRHLVLLHDDWFDHFVQHATVVEPHVRINDESGTADDGGLFYTENLPPECLLVSVAMASRSRKPAKNAQEGGGPDRVADMSAEDVLEYVRAGFHGRLVQLGGDATTGRGQVIVSGFGWPTAGA